MQSVTTDTFGQLVAYLVPGATALYGVSPYIPAVQGWLAATPADAPTVGGFLYLTVSGKLLARDFDPPRPNTAWSADITYVPTADGWLYLAVVEDLFSWMVVG